MRLVVEELTTGKQMLLKVRCLTEGDKEIMLDGLAEVELCRLCLEVNQENS